jgi:hypothetical protein
MKCKIRPSFSLVDKKQRLNKNHLRKMLDSEKYVLITSTGDTLNYNFKNVYTNDVVYFCEKVKFAALNDLLKNQDEPEDS